MLRRMALATGLLMVVTSRSVFGDEVPLSEDEIAVVVDLADDAVFNATVDAYASELNYREQAQIDPQAHGLEIQYALAHLDGVVIAKTDGWSARWNASTGHADIFDSDGQPVAMSWGTDYLGRMIFSNDFVVGRLDTSGGLLLIDSNVQGSHRLTIGPIPQGTDNMSQPPVLVCGKVCLCWGSTAECPDGNTDCYNSQTCTLPGGGGSSCRYGDAPAPPQPPKKSCGCPIAMIMYCGSFVGLVRVAPTGVRRRQLWRH